MSFQSKISKMFKADNSAEETYSHLRVVHPQEELQKVEETPEQEKENTVALSDAEITYNWLKHTFQTQEARLKSEDCLFGTFSITVPVKECNPEHVKEFMKAHNIPLIGEKSWFNLKTKELQEVRLTFDTPTEGIVYMF